MDTYICRRRERIGLCLSLEACIFFVVWQKGASRRPTGAGRGEDIKKRKGRRWAEKGGRPKCKNLDMGKEEEEVEEEAHCVLSCPTFASCMMPSLSFPVPLVFPLPPF